MFCVFTYIRILRTLKFEFSVLFTECIFYKCLSSQVQLCNGTIYLIIVLYGPIMIHLENFLIFLCQRQQYLLRG